MNGLLTSSQYNQSGLVSEEIEVNMDEEISDSSVPDVNQFKDGLSMVVTLSLPQCPDGLGRIKRSQTLTRVMSGLKTIGKMCTRMS